MKRRKENDRLTIMVVPHGTRTSGMKQFEVSISSIRFIWVLFIVIVSLSVVAFASTANRVVNGARLEGLSRENEILKKRVEEVITKNEQLETRLAKLEKATVNLKVIAGLTKESKKRAIQKAPPKKQKANIRLTNKNKIVKTKIGRPKGGQGGNYLAQTQSNAVETMLKEGRDAFREGEITAANVPSLILPAKGRITSGFGYRRSPFTSRREFHGGIDIAAPVGTPIYAAADGKVTYVGWKKGYGKVLKIDHGGGIETIYGHTSTVKVEEGQEISQGDVIALIGNTGRSTGAHLHYEIKVNKRCINPRKHLH